MIYTQHTIVTFPTAMTFRVYQSQDGWRWRLVGANGEIVAQGEAYTRKADALRAVRRLKSEVWRATVEVE